MIPIVTQERPSVLSQYWCGKCGVRITRPHPIEGKENEPVWKFCPHCGEPIEYDKAVPVQWAEQNCERCGSWLIMKRGDSSGSYFMASSDYVGAPICRTCMEEHCAQTNCIQCEIGQWPNCPYSWIKKFALEKGDNT